MDPRRQGDFGERSALNWLIDQGASVYLPFGHSPDLDLVAFYRGRLVGVQVKSTTGFRNGRWVAALATRGGNRRWSGVAKYFSSERCDFLFVHAGDGRRWFIPAERVEARAGLILGGPKYAEFEVARGEPIPRG